jgi:hypothetical protein
MNLMQEEKKHDCHQTLQPQYPQTRLQKYNKKPRDAVTMRHAQTCVKYIIDSPSKTSRAICEEWFICCWVHPFPLVLQIVPTPTIFAKEEYALTYNQAKQKWITKP